MTPDARATELYSASRELLAGWSDVWGRPGLEDSVDVEISRRMSRALGLAHPGRRVIRIAHALLTAPAAAFAEVLCHEAAHVVVFERYRRSVRPHGSEWAVLMRAAGYEPRTRVDPRDLGIVWSPPPRRPRARYIYEHRCRACGMNRRARRAVRQWRCARCHAAGLSGELEIRRWPEAAGRRFGWLGTALNPSD
ncbi:MAG: SprT-like domain-containing protein [Candidatus Binatia bacterium]|nr:SprT-like domain-containing protein [Candidatus Binatia bacterium]